MVDSVQVRWCPRCRAWGRARRMAADTAQAFVADDSAAPVAFEYVREDYRCASCEDRFVATRITQCPRDHVWSARSVLARLRANTAPVAQACAIPLSWDGHPELADFSAHVARPALN